jgi:hypothetical protein
MLAASTPSSCSGVSGCLNSSAAMTRMATRFITFSTPCMTGVHSCSTCRGRSAAPVGQHWRGLYLGGVGSH